MIKKKKEEKSTRQTKKGEKKNEEGIYMKGKQSIFCNDLTS